MFFGMFMTGVASLVFYSMDLFLSQEAGLGLWALFSILLWLFLICIPEESEPHLNITALSFIPKKI